MSSVFRQLAEKKIVLPYLENAFHNDRWPDLYTITVDSQPYYGMEDENGDTHDGGSGDGYFHPSSHPLMSPRELWFRFHPEHSKTIPPERRTLTSHITLAAGSAMHAVIQTQLNMAKILRKGGLQDSVWRQIGDDIRGRVPEENPYEFEYINDRHKVRGRLDGILDHPAEGDLLFELKTMNPRAYRFQENWKDQWYAQVQMGMDNYGLDRAILVLLEMAYPWSVREFDIPRDRDFISKTYEKFDYVRECIEHDIPPVCGHSLGSKEAKMCPSNKLCWGE